jgi:hypothetical protein
MASVDEGATLGSGASRPASLVTGLAVGIGMALVAATAGTGAGVAVTAAAGVGLGLAVLGSAREGPAWTAVVSVLTPLVALAGVAGVVLLAADRGAAALARPLAFLPTLALALGTGLAAFGAAATLGDGIGEGAVSRAWRTASATATVVVVAAGALVGGRTDALDSFPVPAVDPGALLGPVLTPAGPTVGLVSFATLVVAAALAGRAALSTLPVVELTHRRRREATRESVARVDAALLAAVKYGVLAACASALTVLPPVRDALPVVALAGPVASGALRGALLALAAVAGGVALAGRLLQAAAGDTASALGRVLPVTAGGVGVVVGALLGGDAVRALVAGLPPTVRPVAGNLLDALSPAGLLLGATLVALTALTTLLTALVVANAVGLVPARGSGGALAGAGLGAAAVVLGTEGAAPLAVFVLVGLAVVAWDVSDQGVSARADLGAGSAARIETVHAVASVGVAALGVGAAWAVSGLVGAVALPGGALVGAIVAVAGSVILLGLLRG